MNITIKESNMCSGTFTHDYLASRGNCQFKFIRANGKSIAIAHQGQLDSIRIPVVTIIEETKVPLWKQSMQLQMGRVPQQSIEDRRTYRVEPIKDEQLKRYRFEVYEICR